MSSTYTKERGAMSTGPIGIFTYVHKPTGVVHGPNISNGQVGKTERATAQWRRMKPLWPSATEMVMVKRQYTSSWTSATFEEPNYSNTWTGRPSYMANRHPPLPGTAPRTTTSMTQSSAMSRALDQYQSMVAKRHGEFIDLGETLGSARETVTMVVKRTKQFDTFLRHLRDRNTNGVISSLAVKKPTKNFRQKVIDAMSRKSTADAFLELKFGWLQLMQDIYDGLQVKSRLYQAGQHNRFRTGLLSPDGVVKGDATLDGMPVMGGKAGMYTRVHNHRLANLTALGLTNPVMTAWQLMPLSFVADWFLPVGKLLSAMTGLLGMTAYGGWVIGVSGTVRSYGTYGWDYQDLTVVRQPVVTGFEAVSIGVDLETRMGLGQVAVTVALIRQRLGEIDDRPKRLRRS